MRTEGANENLLSSKQTAKPRLIAFYLPQYHPIPENDNWWGGGFTDWINVARAKPKFKGHYQPHIPADLGFYDLRSKETRIEQAEMAAEYNIGGFCYYHYWFNGKMLLERPFNEVLHSGEPDFPFCLCWANENWTRRWDGRDKTVLMRQSYDKYDCNHHIEWLAKAFSDKRYITVNGKALFLIYFPSDIPNIGRIIASWRQTLKSKGCRGLYLCSVESFRNKLSEEEAVKLGFDAVINFQPNLKNYPQRYIFRDKFQKIIRKLMDKLHLYRFYSRIPVTNIISYKALVEKVMSDSQSKNVVFPCVMPSWDNSPRKKVSTVIQNDDAGIYGKWLEHALSKVKNYPLDERIVFINSWNEWAEGCHLEPDLKNGRKFLEATREALNKFYR